MSVFYELPYGQNMLLPARTLHFALQTTSAANET